MIFRPDSLRLEDETRRGLVAAGARGGAAAVVLGDRVWTIAQGEAGPGRSVTASTPFHICSCSKTFTAAVFSALVVRGVTSWDAPVADVAPEIEPFDARFGGRSTFRDLASMRLGLGRAGIAEWGIDQTLSKVRRLARGRHIAPAAPFRDRFSYSNLSYIALSLAAERLSGRPYADLVADLICSPLGMTGAVSVGEGSVPPADAATPFLPGPGGGAWVRDLTGPNSEGSARMYLSADDAARWMQFLLAAHSGSDAGPLPSAAVREMASPQIPVRDPDIRQAPEPAGGAAYGLGLSVGQLGGRRLLRHGGGGRGWRHAMALAPDQDAGVMVMAAAESPVIEALALELLESAVRGSPRRPWRTFFAQAAAASAAAERRMIDGMFPAADGPPAEVRPGRYASASAGQARIEATGRGLSIAFEEAPDFTAALRPLGGPVFELEFEEPALAAQPLDPPFRIGLVDGTDGARLRTTYFGELERLG